MKIEIKTAQKSEPSLETKIKMVFERIMGIQEEKAIFVILCAVAKICGKNMEKHFKNQFKIYTIMIFDKSLIRCTH